METSFSLKDLQMPLTNMYGRRRKILYAHLFNKYISQVWFALKQVIFLPTTRSLPIFFMGRYNGDSLSISGNWLVCFHLAILSLFSIFSNIIFINRHSMIPRKDISSSQRLWTLPATWTSALGRFLLFGIF